MKVLSTLYLVSVFLVITMVAFILVFNFMVGLDVFGTTTYEGQQLNDDGQAFFNETTNVSYAGAGEKAGMDAVWSLLIGSSAGLIGGALLGWAFHSTTLVGISLYSGTFWSSFIGTWGILNISGWIPLGFLSIFFVLMLFLFTGSIVGMLTGSG